MREDYVARINRVVDHIEAHLSEPLRLAELASVAAFSQFHFHRIFAALVGEAPGQFIHRVRLERAAAILRQNHKLSITEIALDAGFASSSTFARAFKEQFGVSASDYRSGIEADSDSKISKANRKMGESIRNGGIRAVPERPGPLCRGSRRRDLCASQAALAGQEAFRNKSRCRFNPCR